MTLFNQQVGAYTSSGSRFGRAALHDEPILSTRCHRRVSGCPIRASVNKEALALEQVCRGTQEARISSGRLEKSHPNRLAGRDKIECVTRTCRPSNRNRCLSGGPDLLWIGRTQIARSNTNNLCPASLRKQIGRREFPVCVACATKTNHRNRELL